MYRIKDALRNRRIRRNVAEVTDHAHVVWAQALLREKPWAITDKRGGPL